MLHEFDLFVVDFSYPFAVEEIRANTHILSIRITSFVSHRYLRPAFLPPLRPLK
jgi:hypothetical protein